MDRSAVPQLDLLGIDEIALKNGYKDFVVIVSGLTSQPEKYILAVLPYPKKETVKAFLRMLPPPGLYRHERRLFQCGSRNTAQGSGGG